VNKTRNTPDVEKEACRGTSGFQNLSSARANQERCNALEREEVKGECLAYSHRCNLTYVGIVAPPSVRLVKQPKEIGESLRNSGAKKKSVNPQENHVGGYPAVIRGEGPRDRRADWDR